MICPNCEYENIDNAKFCLECGEKLIVKEVKTCNSCSIELQPNAKFCLECGEKVNSLNICPECGIENKPLVRFCSECGYSFNALQQKKKDYKLTKEIHHHYNNNYQKKAATPFNKIAAILNLIILPGLGYFVINKTSTAWLIILLYIVVQAINALLILIVVGLFTFPVCEIGFRVVTCLNALSTNDENIQA